MTEFVAKLRVRLESVARKTLKNILLNHINLILKNFIVLLRIKKALTCNIGNEKNYSLGASVSVGKCCKCSRDSGKARWSCLIGKGCYKLG